MSIFIVINIFKEILQLYDQVSLFSFDHCFSILILDVTEHHLLLRSHQLYRVDTLLDQCSLCVSVVLRSLVSFSMAMRDGGRFPRLVQPTTLFPTVGISRIYFDADHLFSLSAIGIYVVMFLHILSTVIRVIAVFSVLFIAFGLTFHILLIYDVRHLLLLPRFRLLIESFSAERRILQSFHFHHPHGSRDDKRLGISRHLYYTVS